jgi:hypothetical protein
MPIVDELSPEELNQQMELAAEQLIERFHMDLELSQDYRRRVHPSEFDQGLRLAA